jgi:hypothetical protein
MKDLKYILKGLAFFTLYVVAFLLMIKTLWFPLLAIVIGGSWLIGRTISK